MWDWDLLSGTIFFSTRWLAILGYAEGELRATPEEWLTRLHPDDEARVREELRTHTGDHSGRDTGEFHSEHRIRNKQDEYQWVLSRGAVMRGEDGRALRFAGSLTDIAASKGSDPLTGLGNRLFALERIEAARKAVSLKTVSNKSVESLALVLLDLDGFKIVNDSFGHHTGDRLLCEVAGRIRTLVSELGLAGASTISRIGGDEFTVLLERLEGPEQAGMLAGRLVERIAEPTSISGFQISVSASAGVARVTSETVTSAEDSDARRGPGNVSRKGTGQEPVGHVRAGNARPHADAHDDVPRPAPRHREPAAGGFLSVESGSEDAHHHRV